MRKAGRLPRVLALVALSVSLVALAAAPAGATSVHQVDRAAIDRSVEEEPARRSAPPVVDRIFPSDDPASTSPSPETGSGDPRSALTATDIERWFVAAINAERAAHDLGPLERHVELEDQARAWTDVLVAEGDLRHARDLSIGVTESWALLGENVGQSNQGLQVLFDAFVASPTHLENILEPGFDSIGVGAVVRAGRVWTVHRFMDRAHVDPASPRRPAGTWLIR